MEKFKNILKTKWQYVVMAILAIVALGYSGSAAKLEVANEEIATLEERVTKLETSNKNLEKSIDSYIEEKEELDKNLSESKKELDQAKKDLDTSNKSLEESKKEVETLSAKAVEATTATEPSSTASAVTTGNYIANANTGKFHYAGCSSVRQMNEGNKVYFTDRESAAASYSPCQRCHP